MESPLSSPERPLKVTHLERKKRKRTLSNQLDFDTETGPISKPDIPPMTIAASPSSESITSKGPKKVEVSLPGPSPKRPRHDTNESTKGKEPSKAKKPTHVRSASSISSMGRVAELSGDTPSARKKPLSSRKPQSKVKSVVAEDDDCVSVADSSISVKARRNEAERIEYFQNQPECGKMEPHHVQCLRCEKSVNLGRKQTYATRPWEIHRARCDQKPAKTVGASPATEKAVAERTVPDTPSASPMSEGYVARRQTEEERKAYLESDQQAETVEEGRVRCRKCQIWIILSDKQTFSTGKWVKHKSRCSDIVPSNRVAAAKRKLLVVNDPQAKSFDARRIECTFCGTNVTLQGEGEFNLTSWDEHKAQCTRLVPVARSESVNFTAFPRQFSRTPPSPASTEKTLIAPESVPAGIFQSLKRVREEAEATAEETERPTLRPRTETYVPHEKEAPSPFGWFLLPFKSFAQGFRESLKNGS